MIKPDGGSSKLLLDGEQKRLQRDYDPGAHPFAYLVKGWRAQIEIMR